MGEPYECFCDDTTLTVRVHYFGGAEGTHDHQRDRVDPPPTNANKSMSLIASSAGPLNIPTTDTSNNRMHVTGTMYSCT